MAWRRCTDGDESLLECHLLSKPIHCSKLDTTTLIQGALFPNFISKRFVRHTHGLLSEQAHPPPASDEAEPRLDDDS